MIFVHAERSFSVQTLSCVPRVFLPINIENNYIIKTFLSIVLKHGGKSRTCEKMRKNSRQIIVSLKVIGVQWIHILEAK